MAVVSRRIGTEPKPRRLVYNDLLMGKSLKRVLACLLMLAIPLQGFAATAMLTCGPIHQRVSAGAGGAHGHEHGPGHVHDAAHEHSHGAAAQAQDHAAHHDHDAQDDGAAAPDLHNAPMLSAVGEFDQVAKASCSACASCCSGAAMVSSTAVPAVSAAITALFVAAMSPDLSFITDGPSRPPRPHLA